MKYLKHIIIFLYTSFVFSQSQTYLEALPVLNTDKNVTSSISYDLSGATINKGVSYFNHLGKGLQQQNWDKLTGRVWASEVRYDYFNRPALQTLSAPINNLGDFSYRPDFIRTNGSALTIMQYDTNTTLFNPPIISSEVNTLGWYYSSLNNLDVYQDITQYPYSRSIYSELNPGQVKSVLGGNKINGQWLQSYSFNMAMEKPSNSSDSFYSAFLNKKVIKTVSRDVHGVETVVFTDTDGNTLGGARSGPEGTVRNVYSEILDKGFVDIHIPTGCEGNVQLYTLATNYQIRVFDLITEQVIPSSINTTASITLAPGFYRFEDQNNIYGKNTSLAPIRILYKVNYYDVTKNVYDFEGRLTQSTQPLTTSAGQELKSTFVYDSLGLLKETTSPDEGASSFKYRDDGQIRFSQNVEQRKKGEFSYTNYDNLGRPIESGVYKGTGILFSNPEVVSSTANDLYNQIQDDIVNSSIVLANNKLDLQAKNSITLTTGFNAQIDSEFSAKIFDSTQVNLSDLCYQNALSTYNGPPLVDCIVNLEDGLPLVGRKEQNFTVYDLPDNELLEKLTSCGIPLAEFKQSFLAGNVSYTYTQNPTTNKTWYSYDVFGRVQWIVQEVDGLGCLKTIQYQYDPANGQVVKIIYQKYNQSETFVHKYDYNVVGQLTSVFTSTDDVAFTKQAQYKYNESGELIRTELAEDAQGIDYVYNLNGQLKAINHPSLQAANDPGGDGANGFATDLFGMALDYYTGDYLRSNTPKPVSSIQGGVNQYNGNIKATRWNTNIASATQNAYTYQYNKNNWLSQASFGSANSTGNFTPNTSNDYLEGNITYDANGNILTLKRNGYTDAAGDNKMDDLQYKYQNNIPNRLSYVKDTNDNTSPSRYNDIKNQEKPLAFGLIGELQPNYLYNDLGQMIYNAQDKVGYEYNASGLVEKITTNSTENTNNFIIVSYNNYYQNGLSGIKEIKKWLPIGLDGTVTNPYTLTQDLACNDIDNGYSNDSFRILGSQLASTKLRVLPNSYTKVELDLLVDKYLYREYKDNSTGQIITSCITQDVNPTVKIRLRRPDGSLVAGSEQVITNQPVTQCNHFFDKHINIDYTTGSEEWVTLEIETLKEITPSYPDVNLYKQRIFVDNILVKAAQDTKIAFYYNDRGQRVRKENYQSGITTTTYYVRDVTGTVIAVYQGQMGPTIKFPTNALVENGVYGGSRIGVYKRSGTESFTLYELTDHLGNVRAVFRKTPAGVVALTAKTDYYPFGMPMPNKQITDQNYRYAFQGQEKDPETGMEAFELRLWDGRLGRWLTIDPYGQYFSPYLGMGNLPTLAIDDDGGRVIIGIKINGENILYEYRDGQLYNMETGDVQGFMPNEFVKNVRNALNTIKSKPFGKSFVNFLEKDTNDYYIYYGANEMHEINARKVVVDPKKMVETYLTNGLMKSPFFISFVHELAHLFGKMNKRGNNSFWMRINGTPITHHEEYASLIENKIRDENGFSLRTHYSHFYYDDGTTGPDDSTRLFNSSNVNQYLQSADNFNVFMFRLLNFQFQMNQSKNNCNCK